MSNSIETKIDKWLLVDGGKEEWRDTIDGYGASFGSNEML